MANEMADSALGGDTGMLTFMGHALSGFGQGVADVQDAGVPDEEAPDVEASATTATPDESPADPTASASAEDSDGTDEAATEGDPQGSEAPAPDPLDGFTPASYKADGQERSFDGMLIHPEHGALIDKESVPKLLERLSMADHAEQANRTLYDQYRQLERATAWTTKGANGQDETVTGARGIEAQRVALARANAALSSVVNVLKNPAALANLLTLDDAGNVVQNQANFQHLITQSQLAEIQAEQQARQQLAGMLTQQEAPAQINYDSQGPSLVESAAQYAGVSNLTPEDKATAVQLLPKFVRAATPDDRVQNPQLQIGQPVIDATFHALLQRMAKTGTVTPAPASKADKSNQARLAAARVTPAVAPKPQARRPSRAPAQPTGPTMFSMTEDAASGHFLGG